VADRPLLLSVPNVSEGRDRSVVDRIARGMAPARVLDLHLDPDHHRSVLSVTGRQGELAGSLLGAAGAAVEQIDLRRHDGLHPRVGALDVAPVVHLADRDRGAATAEALTAAALIGDELGLPVFLYGDLATAEAHRERAALRAGGPAGLARRVAAGEVVPDYGPRHLHPSAGAVLVTARPPLVAFNVDLTVDDLDLAREIAAGLREAGGGLPGVRALGLSLPARGRAQVSTNVHDHRRATLAAVVAAVRARAEVAEAEIVGLVPAAALEDFPADVPIRAFDPQRQVIERALAALPGG
jgi:glutamate formiminotransferase